MTHLDICNTSYGKKKGWESNWQFDSWPQKVGNWPDFGACRWRATRCWKTFNEKLQLRFRPHPNRRSMHEVIDSQSYKNSSLGSFGTLLWESRDKKPFGCGPRGEVQSILYGEGGDFLQVRVMVSLVSLRSRMACLSTKGAPTLC